MWILERDATWFWLLDKILFLFDVDYYYAYVSVLEIHRSYKLQEGRQPQESIEMEWNFPKLDKISKRELTNAIAADGDEQYLVTYTACFSSSISSIRCDDIFDLDFRRLFSIECRLMLIIFEMMNKKAFD